MSRSNILRPVLVLDMVTCTAAALLLLAGGSYLAPLLNLPEPLLMWAGIVLIPFIALLGYALKRPAVSRPLLLEIVLLNALWVALSLALLLSGLVSPNALGVAFIAVQALAVAGLTLIQFSVLRAMSHEARA